MYTGRTISAIKLSNGTISLNYFVNSKSFKNREFFQTDGTVAVVPNEDSTKDFRNPYVTYNCARYNTEYVVLSNGSQTDPVFEKVVRGTPPRDALTQVLHGIDYEFDGHNTPRITVIASVGLDFIFAGIVKKDEIHIKKIPLQYSELFLFSTNEYNNLIGQNLPQIDVEGTNEKVFQSIHSTMEHNVVSLNILVGSKISVQTF